MECDNCGSELVKDEFSMVYVCKVCGQRWVFRKDFDKGMVKE